MHKSIATATGVQPPPKDGKDDVYKHVMKDIEDRVEMGYQRYGTYLKSFNGRDPLVDAYQEAIDLVFYLRQELLERELV